MDRKFFLPFVALLMNFLLGKMFNIFYAYAINAKKLKILVNMKKICIWKRCMLCWEEERGITYREWDPCVVSTICIVADTGSSGWARISAEYIPHPKMKQNVNVKMIFCYEFPKSWQSCVFQKRQRSVHI